MFFGSGDAFVLDLIALAALVLGFGTGIWRMFKGPETEEIDGRKSLTRSGYISILLACFAFLLSLSAFGFGVIVKQQDAANAAAKTEREKEMQEQRDSIANLTLALQELNLEENRDQAARAEISRLEKFADEIARDQRFDRKVSGQNTQNLRRIDETLLQIDRALKPLRRIGIHIDAEYYPEIFDERYLKECERLGQDEFFIVNKPLDEFLQFSEPRSTKIKDYRFSIDLPH